MLFKWLHAEKTQTKANEVDFSENKKEFMLFIFFFNWNVNFLKKRIFGSAFRLARPKPPQKEHFRSQVVV